MEAGHMKVTVIVSEPDLYRSQYANHPWLYNNMDVSLEPKLCGECVLHFFTLGVHAHHTVAL